MESVGGGERYLPPPPAPQAGNGGVVPKVSPGSRVGVRKKGRGAEASLVVLCFGLGSGLKL